ncbi:MAG: glycosyltransferase [Fidelibacterota bacterium]|nr:MAG: glycosyltransferase [Candidatus Neomarinimicrobiota bacterium]
MKLKDARVLMASSVHRWNDVRIYYKEALTLAKVTNVRLLAVQNYSASQVPHRKIETEFLPGNGLTRGGPNSMLSLRLRRIAAVLRTALAEKFDVFHFHDPELIPVGWLVKLRGKRVIYDMHEDVSTMLFSREWLPRPLARLIGSVLRAGERLSLHIFDYFILAAKNLAPSFKTEKCVQILNYPIANTMPRSQGRKQDEPLRLVYAGDITVARGIPDILTAISDLQRAGQKITLDLFGPVSEPEMGRVLGTLTTQPWIKCHGWIPLPQLMNELPGYHIGMSPLRDFPNYRNAVPTKVLDYLAAGLPVVASGLPGTRKLLEKYDCALLYEPGDVAKLQAALLELQDERKRRLLAKNGGKFVAAYSWETQAQKLVGIYQELLQ